VDWPIVILGTPLNSPPRPWYSFEVDGLIINALELGNCVEQPRALLGFEGRFLLIDSGGFQVMKKGLDLSVDFVAKLYTKCIADAYLSLDYPPTPNDDSEVAEKKYEASFRNWLRLRRILGDAVVPILHIYRDENLFYKYLKKYLDYNPPMLAIGAAVPYILITRGVPRGSRLFAIRLIAEARAEYHGWLHVLGLGSPSITPVLAALKVNSTDTSTWRVKAAYGKIILPGGGERHVTSRDVRFGRRKLRDEELVELLEFLRRTGFKAINEVDEMLGSFEGRALINAWVVTRSRESPRPRTFTKLLTETIQIAKDLGITVAQPVYLRRTYV